MPRAKAGEEASRKAVRYSAFYGGKVATTPKVPIRSLDDFSIWYTPGVAAVSKIIQRDVELSFEYTNRWNSIAIGAGTDVAIETAKVVLMKSDPADVLRAIRLSKATVRKMKQNLFWASFYNIIAIPVAAGILYPGFGISLRPEISALLMSASSIIVATNAVLLKRAEKQLVSV